MDYRVVFLCMVTVYGQLPEYFPQQESSESIPISAENNKFNKSSLQDKDYLKLKSSGEFINQHPVFLKKSLSGENNLNKIGFSQPLQFISPARKDGSDFNTYKTTTDSSESDLWDQNSKATDREIAEDSYSKKKKPVVYKQPKRPIKARGASTYGKSSHPKKSYKAHQYKSSIASVPDQPKDVEMILPHDKVIFLPMVNGKPKPYDGYRAAPEEEIYQGFGKANKKESEDQRERRLSQGEIIYGKPKIAVGPSFHRHFKRSPAQYYGGIYPYYDYSDSKLHRGRLPSPATNGRKAYATIKRKKIVAYPKEAYHATSGNPYNVYNYRTENKRKDKENEDSQELQSKEVSKEAESESEETSEENENESEESPDDQQPLYKYSYDNTFQIPQLNVKFYPYEKKLRDSNVEGSKKKESYKQDDNDDEFTEGYERYVKTLPLDLETYFGKPDHSDKYTVGETQNLENNKNCKKVEPAPQKEENSQGKAEQTSQPEENQQHQICYVCLDEKTGDTYEQCAYQSQPVSKKYFFGGSKSFKTNDTSEPSTYRYKRSPFSYKPDTFKSGESELSEMKENKNGYKFPYFGYNQKPKKKNKKKYKKKKKESNLDFFEKENRKSVSERRKRGGFDGIYGILSEPSNHRGRASLDQPPKSYDGPKYTYHGPASTYEGPAEPYEGPKKTYEGPINQEYYDTTDERIADDEEESQNQEYHSSLPLNYYNGENNNNQKKRNFSPYYEYRPYDQEKYSNEEYQDEIFKPAGYTGDYRFGPEHFLEEEEEQHQEVSKNEKLKGSMVSEKKGPHKFPPQETNSAAATSSKEKKEEVLGESKVFKNGDKCQKKRKDRMICMECKNEKTGATYEQCQYSTKPKEKFYAFGTQKSYSAKKPTAPQKIEADTSDLFPETSDVVEKKLLIKTHNKVFGSDPVPTESLILAESNNSPQVQPTDPAEHYSGQVETPTEEQKQNDTSNADIGESAERIEPRDGIEGLEEYLYGARDSVQKASEEEKQSFKSYDDYFHDLFPDFAKSSEPVPESDEKEESESERLVTFDPFANIRQFHEENARYHENHSKEEENEKDAEASRPEEVRLKDRKSRIPLDFFTPYSEDHKKDLEAALGEFQKKDWSNCKKIVKKKLTCYQCVDKNGVNNEECMYVEASQPISKHLSYHERKDLLPLRLEGTNETAGTNDEGIQTEKNFKRFRKAKNSQTEVVEVERPADAEYLKNHTKKGDFEGVETLETKDANKSSETEHLEPTILKSQPGKIESKQKRKRHKTEAETETSKAAQNSEFPVSKLKGSNSKREKLDAESFGLKLPAEEKIAASN